MCPLQKQIFYVIRFEKLCSIVIVYCRNLYRSILHKMFTEKYIYRGMKQPSALAFCTAACYYFNDDKKWEALFPILYRKIP